LNIAKTRSRLVIITPEKTSGFLYGSFLHAIVVKGKRWDEKKKGRDD
jgi:hypothetical protein